MRSCAEPEAEIDVLSTPCLRERVTEPAALPPLSTGLGMQTSLLQGQCSGVKGRSRCLRCDSNPWQTLLLPPAACSLPASWCRMISHTPHCVRAWCCLHVRRGVVTMHNLHQHLTEQFLRSEGDEQSDKIVRLGSSTCWVGLQQGGLWSEHRSLSSAHGLHSYRLSNRMGVAAQTKLSAFSSESTHYKLLKFSVSSQSITLRRQEGEAVWTHQTVLFVRARTQRLAVTPHGGRFRRAAMP